MCNYFVPQKNNILMSSNPQINSSYEIKLLFFNCVTVNENTSSLKSGVRRGVLMGTKAIYSNSQHDLCFPSQSESDTFSLSPSPLPEAYVLSKILLFYFTLLSILFNYFTYY